MGRFVFNLPDIGEGIAEAELIAWHVAAGDAVEEDQPVADVMTDKATVELTSPVSGRVAVLHGAVGDMLAIRAPLIEFDTDAGAEAEVDDTPPTHVEKAPPPPTPAPEPVEEKAPPSRSRRVKASPAVRGRAKALGIALEDVPSSGPDGRVRQSDLDQFLALQESAGPDATPARTAAPSPVSIPEGDHSEERLTGLRRRIAAKMELSARNIPHFSYVEEVDVTELERAREALNIRYNNSRPKLSLLPFLIRALCIILPRYPRINAVYDEASGTVRRYSPIHMGVATQTEGGLMVPVIRDAQRKSLWELAGEIVRLADAARTGGAKSEELSGSTITVSSLGRLGGIAATPIINHPEVAIIGPNRIVERPMAVEGEVRLRKMMNLSSSFDHRVVDGHDAARFIQDVRDLLEDPVALLAGG